MEAWNSVAAGKTRAPFFFAAATSTDFGQDRLLTRVPSEVWRLEKASEKLGLPVAHDEL